MLYNKPKVHILVVQLEFVVMLVVSCHLTVIGESTMRSFWHSMATNWSIIMAARAQMERAKLEEFNLKGMKSMKD